MKTEVAHDSSHTELVPGRFRELLPVAVPLMLHWTVICIPVGMILYANTFIAQFDGAG